jgi:hypothetical protein
MWILNNFLLYIIMGKKTSKKHQKLYKMKGCSKNKRSRKYLAGGSNSYLAYTGKPIATQSNPFLSYTGGRSDNIELHNIYDVMKPIPSNPYGANPALPNTGPEKLLNSNIPTNMGSFKFGGGCSSCTNLMTGGTCNSCTNTNTNLMTGGRRGLLTGGKTIDPQGLVGSPWTPKPTTWPGVDGVDGNRNYLAYNNLKVDPQTALISFGANNPFLYGGKKHRRTKKRRQKGGTFSNFLGQDFINLGRQIQYNMGSTYNALNGYPSPTQVLPWQGQLPRTPNLNTIRGVAL